MLDQVTTQEQVDHIMDQATNLVARAEAMGVTLSITHKPRQPLAMGNFDHVVEAYPARHGPRARPAP